MQGVTKGDARLFQGQVHDCDGRSRQDPQRCYGLRSAAPSRPCVRQHTSVDSRFLTPSPVPLCPPRCCFIIGLHSPPKIRSLSWERTMVSLPCNLEQSLAEKGSQQRPLTKAARSQMQHLSGGCICRAAPAGFAGQRGVSTATLASKGTVASTHSKRCDLSCPYAPYVPGLKLFCLGGRPSF
jgi:hypothetical protein